MKLFVFRLKIPRGGAQRFSRHLLNSAPVVGITLSEFTRVSDDPESSDTYEVFAFICQAPGSLTPEQLTALTALCTIHKVSKILAMSYTDVTEEEDVVDNVRHLPTQHPPPVRLVAKNGEVIDES